MTYDEVFTEQTVRELMEDGVRIPSKDEMTCDHCPEADTCPFAWDLYNTDNDCLADK